jgi:hypothetical protein
MGEATMKASDKPKISQGWWIEERPDDLKCKDLTRALGSAETALEDAEDETPESIEAGLAALKSLSATVGRTIKTECDKRKHKDVIAVLKKFDGLIQGEQKRLEKLAEEVSDDEDEEEEDEDKGILKPAYLTRMIKQLRGGSTLQFCFGLNKSTPGASRLLLCNKRQADQLHKILKRTGEFSDRLMTFGQAAADGKVLEFKLSDGAKEPSQIVKVAKEFLKGNRDLKFKKIRVLVDGEAFEADA